MRDPELRFVKRNEADLKKRLDKAQQAAAKVAPGIDRLYDLLRDGAADAERLTSPRWRAGFDLAFGRVCAAKARNDGYNSMLAALKRGRAFQRSDSTTWVLQRAKKSSSSSTLETLAERAQKHLQRVLDEHAGTPWAELRDTNWPRRSAGNGPNSHERSRFCGGILSRLSLLNERPPGDRCAVLFDQRPPLRRSISSLKCCMSARS